MWSRLRAYFRTRFERRDVAAEVEDELPDHLEMETEANRAPGLPPPEARRPAPRELGGVTQTRESIHHVRSLGLDALWRELRFALRRLWRERRFTVMAM